MPGFGDTAVIALIALLLFGPKKLPVLARQLGKLMAEFRRASNEFRSQMEEELRISEQADRQKEIAALEAASANKISPPVEPEATPHTATPESNFASPEESDRVAEPQTEFAAATDSAAASTPIATSGELTMMPPETGLPVGRSNAAGGSNGAAGSNGTATGETQPSPPATHTSSHEAELEPETLHG